MRARLGALGRQTFSALAIPNYRRYFFGQGLSLVGTWMQSTAQAWLVLTLTHSSTDLGFIVALQTLPVLLLGPYGGVIADRVDKRRLMVVLQCLMGLQALALGLLTVFGVVTFAEVGVLAVILGLNNTFENPSRQAFIREMVGTAEVRNAVTLNAVTVNAARAVGPAVAGMLIAVVGVGVCFIANAASFVAVVASLLVMDRATLRPATPTPRTRGQLREGVAYAARTTEIAVPLLMMGLVGMLTYEFQVSLPVLARTTFHGGAVVYGFMTGMMGIGAVVGGLITAARGKTGLRAAVLAAAAFGAATGFTALAPSLALAYAGLFFVGWTSVAYITISNATIQLASAPGMRGRVLALWFLGMQGTTPIGGPVIGWVIDESEPRVGLLVGALAALVAAGAGTGLALRRGRHVPHPGLRSASGPLAESALGRDPGTDRPARSA